MKKNIKKAFITDWLDKYGGAERVVTAINEIYDFDYYFTYINNMKESDLLLTFAGKKINISESKYLTSFGPFFRYVMPLFPIVVKLFNRQERKKEDIDLVISSSWVISKGFRVGNEIHICYLQARNFKYVWEEHEQYFKGPLKLLSFLKKPLRNFDVSSAQNPNYLISNSIFVQNWVKNKYNRESHLIYPPVDVDDFFISATTEDYYITVGRLEAYKRFDLIIDAFNDNGKKLIVIGDGVQSKFLKSKSKSNIVYKGYLKKKEINVLLSKSKAFIYAGVEDFGIVLVEALASGTPVIGYKGGAIEEIVVDELDGVLYNQQTVQSLNEAIISFEAKWQTFDKLKIKERASRFSKARFQQEFKEFVDSKLT